MHFENRTIIKGVIGTFINSMSTTYKRSWFSIPEVLSERMEQDEEQQSTEEQLDPGGEPGVVLKEEIG